MHSFKRLILLGFTSFLFVTDFILFYIKCLHVGDDDDDDDDDAGDDDDKLAHGCGDPHVVASGHREATVFKLIVIL